MTPTEHDRRIAEEAAQKISDWNNAIYFGEVAPALGPIDIILAAIDAARAQCPTNQTVAPVASDKTDGEGKP